MVLRIVKFLVVISILLPLQSALSLTYTRIDKPENVIGHYTRIAVLPFETGTDSDYEGTRVADRLATHLAQEGFLQMIERMQIEKIISESDFSREDLADTATAVAIGKLLGADAIIIGRVDSKYSESKYQETVWKTEEYYVWEGGRQVKKTRKAQKTVPILMKNGEVNIDTKVVEVETARIVAAKVAYHNWENKGVDVDEITALPARSSLMEVCLNNCMNILIRAYTPHRVVLERELRPQRKASTEILQARELAESGLYEEALEIFEKVIEEDPQNMDIKGNIAILLEALGRYDEADVILEATIREAREIKQKTAHPLIDYRTSLRQAWHFVEPEEIKPTIIVVSVDDNDTLCIDAGTNREIQVGTRFKVCREEPRIHPVTGEEIGRIQTDLALIEIIEVQDRMSIARIIELYDPENEIQMLDAVIPLES